ncbi:Testican-2 [Anabarilius grahami]|uniref:Testican-2 n=1 Tax=Anabarilius grahami TaxID=495550 RepID=A0A3N0XP23_ANAGA|nr:Testican-2 [Anabarilius grahami]
MSAREAREVGGGNFMEDEQQWLSTVHQYSRTVKHWNRFRDARIYLVSSMIPVISDNKELECDEPVIMKWEVGNFQQ